MRFGVVILPDARWSEARGRWRRAEALGFDHAWTYDHLAWRTLRDAPWMAALPTLAAAALSTVRLRLGPLVASPNFRHPVALAKELMTLDDLSGGRLIVGLGAGGEGFDAAVLGQVPWDAAERARRYAEFVALTDRLLREPATTWRGTFYAAEEARNLPGPIQRPRPPFALAATGPRGMALVARYAQIWVTTGDRTGEGPVPPEAGAPMVAGQMRRLDEACTAGGRDPRSLDRLVLTGPQLDPALSSADRFADAVGRYAEIGVSDLCVPWPRASAPYAGDEATFERIFSERAG